MADNRRLPADLHSTMYLLNLCPHILLTFQQAHLHSTMYLLNLSNDAVICALIPIYIPLCIY